MSCSADCAPPPVVRSRTAAHGTSEVGPLANGAPPFRGRRTKSWSTLHSEVGDSSMPMSSITARPEPSRNSTERPITSAMRRTSPPRCSNRRKSIRPLTITCPLEMLDTRPIAT